MKKILNMLICLIFIFLININVKAETYTLEQVKDAINNSNYYDISAVLGENNLIMNSTNENIMPETVEVEYNDGILIHTYVLESFDPDSYPDFETSSDAYNKIISVALYDQTILYAVAKLHGYKENEINWFLKSVAAKMSIDGYEWVSTDLENGNTQVVFSLDIDKFKLDLKYIDASKPNISIGEITSDSIEIIWLAESLEKIELYISENGIDYNRLTRLDNGLDSSTFSYTDTELESGKTYYYKAVVEKSNNFSDVIFATTLSESQNDNEDISNNENIPNVDDNSNTNNENNNSNNTGVDQPTNNPTTGVFNPILSCIILFVLSIIFIKVLSKKNKIRKI